MTTERRSRLKKYLIRLLESQGSRAWPWLPSGDNIKVAIVDELTSKKVTEHPLRLAPTRYRIFLNANYFKDIQHLSHLQDEIAIAIHMAGKAIGARFAVLPQVEIKPDEGIATNGFRLETDHFEPDILNTVPLAASTKDVPPDAYFIIQGSQIFTLNKPIIHIGRRPDNDLVLNDPRVSRIHAQLRAVGGRYRIIDLNSTGGTFINNSRITSTVLYPGDVISLAGVAVLYGQRTTRPLTASGRYTAELGETSEPKLNTTILIDEPLTDGKTPEADKEG